jgi:cyclopropane fatty-acyl-phospholipid synthase-like methyltransferase
VKDGVVVEHKDLLELLDGFLNGGSAERWTEFYTEGKREIPFLVDKPDESLAAYVESGKIAPPAEVLELGCGNGRNAFYLARKGFSVDAIDFSESAIRLAKANISRENNNPRFFRSSIFDQDYSGKRYDFVYDCGCLHHIAPHRRPGYLDLLKDRLSEGGLFGLVCFTTEGGSGLSDLQVYEERSLKGGLAFTEERLRIIFEKDFEILELRAMKEQASDSALFGLGFLWTVLLKKRWRC